jgi:hypothetical protein
MPGKRAISRAFFHILGAAGALQAVGDNALFGQRFSQITVHTDGVQRTRRQRAFLNLLPTVSLTPQADFSYNSGQFVPGGHLSPLTLAESACGQYPCSNYASTINSLPGQPGSRPVFRSQKKMTGGQNFPLTLSGQTE